MPDLPTAAEAGVSEFKAHVWFGVVAPAGTPGEIIAKPNQELVAVMRMPARACACGPGTRTKWRRRR